MNAETSISTDQACDPTRNGTSTSGMCERQSWSMLGLPATTTSRGISTGAVPIEARIQKKCLNNSAGNYKQECMN